jgi:hypothetical protein
MHPAVVGVLSRLGEAELELLVRVEGCRFELALGTIDRVGEIVAVDPSHLRARFDGDSPRGECKIVNLYFSREPVATVAPVAAVVSDPPPFPEAEDPDAPSGESTIARLPPLTR